MKIVSPRIPSHSHLESTPPRGPYILIIIGLDGLGKTPLAEQFTSLGGQYRKIVSSPGDESPALPRAAAEMLEWQDMPTNSFLVYDRFPLPDAYVYSFLTKGHDAFLFTALIPVLCSWNVRFLQVIPKDYQEYRAQKRQEPDPLYPATAIPLLMDNYAYLTRVSPAYDARHYSVEAQWWTQEDAVELVRVLWPGVSPTIS